MGLKLEFTQTALKDLDKLSTEAKQRIVKKLFDLASLDSPLLFAKRLTQHSLGDYRFRIGDYRAIFRLRDGKILFVRIGHRKDIYE